MKTRFTRKRFAAAPGMLLALTGCGYVGPVLPPSPKIPLAITDLRAVERGSKIEVAMTVPSRTADGIDIEEFSRLELRIGPSVEPFNETSWLAGSRAYAAPSPHNEPTQPEPISVAIPVSEWEGKTVAVMARTAVRKRGGDSPWSNRVTLTIVPSLPPPAVTAEAKGDGYHLRWETTAGATHWRVLRQGPSEKEPSIIGEAERPEYIDGSALWDTAYRYTVVAEATGAESDPSKPVSVESADTFPPAVPSGLNALAGPNTIELTWTRNTEADLQGYFVYRSVNDAPMRQVAGPIPLPTWSDTGAEHGKLYRYSVSAIDRKGNPSPQSTPVSINY